MAPIGTQAESGSLQHVACNSPDYIFVACKSPWLYASPLHDSAKPQTHSVRELFQVFDNKALFGQHPKSENQAGWDQDCALARWYQFPGWWHGHDTHQAETQIIDLFYRLFSAKNSISFMAVSSTGELISSGQPQSWSQPAWLSLLGLLLKKRFILKNQKQFFHWMC